LINPLVAAVAGTRTTAWVGDVGSGTRDLWWSERLDKGCEKRVVHEFVDDAIGLLESRWMRRRVSFIEVQQLIPGARGNIDLAGSAGNDVYLHEPVPPPANLLNALA